MVNTMTREEGTFWSHTQDAEVPTRAAQLHIVLRGTERDPGVARRSSRAGKNRDSTSSARRRVHAAIEAESAAVPGAPAESIDQELSRIMSPGPSAGGGTRRRSTQAAQPVITGQPARIKIADPQPGIAKATVPPGQARHLITTFGIMGSVVSGTIGAVLTLRIASHLIAPAILELVLALASTVLIAACGRRQTREEPADDREREHSPHEMMKRGRGLLSPHRRNPAPGKIR